VTLKFRNVLLLGGGFSYRGIFSNQQPVRTDKFVTTKPAFPVTASILEAGDTATNIRIFFV
jgi:hypothetical protein